MHGLAAVRRRRTEVEGTRCDHKLPGATRQRIEVRSNDKQCRFIERSCFGWFGCISSLTRQRGAITLNVFPNGAVGPWVSFSIW